MNNLVEIYGRTYTDCINRGGHQTTRTLLDAATKEACQAVADAATKHVKQLLRRASFAAQASGQFDLAKEIDEAL